NNPVMFVDPDGRDWSQWGRGDFWGGLVNPLTHLSAWGEAIPAVSFDSARECVANSFARGQNANELLGGNPVYGDGPLTEEQTQKLIDYTELFILVAPVIGGTARGGGGSTSTRIIDRTMGRSIR